jgi:hypothetical protein
MGKTLQATEIQNGEDDSILHRFPHAQNRYLREGWLSQNLRNCIVQLAETGACGNCILQVAETVHADNASGKPGALRDLHLGNSWLWPYPLAGACGWCGPPQSAVLIQVAHGGKPHASGKPGAPALICSDQPLPAPPATWSIANTLERIKETNLAKKKHGGTTATAQHMY